MYERLKGVVLRAIKYNDKNSIIRIYTDSHGLLSFLLPQGNGKVSRLKRTLLQPLSLVEIESDITANRDIFRMKEVRSLAPLLSIRTNPAKSSIALFLTELLSHVIVEQEQNVPLFSFISNSIRILEAADNGIANFHICFIYKLGMFIGIEPDIATYTKGSYFDMEGGVFRATRPLHRNFLGQSESAALRMLSRMNFSNMQLFKFNRSQRKQLINLMIEYYRLHNAAIGDIHSLDILSELWE